MKVLLSVLLLVGIVLARPDQKSGDSLREFRYYGPLGPDHWAILYPTCGGTRQSPIDITTSETVAASIEPFAFTNFNVLPSDGVLKNNGHSAVVELSLPNAATITGGDLPGEFEFVNYHFHWGSDSTKGSEHIVDGTQYPLELHMVHWNHNYPSYDDALLEGDGIAVLGVHFVVSEVDNPVLEPVIRLLPNVTEAETEALFTYHFPLMDLLPANTNKFYRYIGSLTTPACNEAVVWTVFTDTVPISERQLSNFRFLQDPSNNTLVDNFRPTQPLNGRVVYLNGGQ